MSQPLITTLLFLLSSRLTPHNINLDPLYLHTKKEKKRLLFFHWNGGDFKDKAEVESED